LACAGEAACRTSLNFHSNFWLQIEASLALVLVAGG
jgi:hypothetical protein